MCGDQRSIIWLQPRPFLSAPDRDTHHSCVGTARGWTGRGRAARGSRSPGRRGRWSATGSSRCCRGAVARAIGVRTRGVFDWMDSAIGAIDSTRPCDALRSATTCVREPPPNPLTHVGAHLHGALACAGGVHDLPIVVDHRLLSWQPQRRLRRQHTVKQPWACKYICASTCIRRHTHTHRVRKTFLHIYIRVCIQYTCAYI